MDYKKSLYLRIIGVILVNALIVAGSMYIIGMSMNDTPQPEFESQEDDNVGKDMDELSETEESKIGESNNEKSTEKKLEDADKTEDSEAEFVTVKQFRDHNVVMRQGPSPQDSLGDYSIQIVNKDENIDLATGIGGTTTFFTSERPYLIDYENVDTGDEIRLLYYDQDAEEKYKIGSYKVEDMKFK